MPPRRRQSAVYGAEGHRDEAGLLRRAPGLIVGVSALQVLQIGAEELQCRMFRTRPVIARRRQRRVARQAPQGVAHHEAEPVARLRWGELPPCPRRQGSIVQERECRVQVAARHDGSCAEPVPVVELDAHGAAPGHRDPPHRCRSVDGSSVGRDHARQRLCEHPRPAPRSVHAAEVIQRLPESERRREGLVGRRARLGGHPAQRPLHPGVAETLSQERAVASR